VHAENGDPGGQDAVIEACAVSSGYDARRVLCELSLAARAGELVGLIGPNGSGKSTLLRVLSRVLPCWSGSVTVRGRLLPDYAPTELARVLAYVPQTEPALFDFTVRQVVMMGRHPHIPRMAAATASDYEHTNRAMALTDVAHLSDRPITMLSGGEHRRVLIARALAQDCPVLLLDEPTAHLDLTHQAGVLRLLARQCRTERTAVVAALHDLNLAADHCDRLLLLAHGRILADGSPDAVLRPEPLRDAYGADVQVARNPLTGHPFVVPADPEPAAPGGKRPRVHLICGGGSGSDIMAEMVRGGYTVSAGVLNRLDTDEQTASALGVTCALEQPFSPIGDAACAEAESLALQADVVVVSSLAVGRGNVRNLQVAGLAADRGIPLILVSESPIAARDFVQGAATSLWLDLERRSAAVLADTGDVERTVRSLSREAKPPDAA